MDELKPCPISPDEARDAYFKLFDMQFDAACDAQSIALGRACGVLDWIASGPDRRTAPENKPLKFNPLQGKCFGCVWEFADVEHYCKGCIRYVSAADFTDKYTRKPEGEKL